MRRQETRTPLIIAAARGNEAEVLHLIVAGADVNAVDSKGRTALMAAVQRRLASLYKPLVHAGADPDRVDWRGRNALTIAIETKDVYSLVWLLGLGADPNRKRRKFLSAYELSITTGNAEMIDLLRSHGGAGAESMLLIAAAGRGDVAGVVAALESGADVGAMFPAARRASCSLPAVLTLTS